MKRLLTLIALLLLASVAWSQQVGALIPEVFTNQVCDPNAANLPPDGSAWKQTLFVSLPASSGNAPPFYPQSPAGLQAAIQAWKVDSADAWYLIVVTSEDAGGTGIHGPTSGQNALINGVSKPGATGCWVIESSDYYNLGLPTHGQTLCSHGIPGVNGGQREPGCTNDIGHLWLLQIDSATVSGSYAFYACGGNNNTWANPQCTSGGAPNPNNNGLIRDAEVTIKPGAAQSGLNKSLAPTLVKFDGGALNMGIEDSYLHGYNPGDVGQPPGGCVIQKSGKSAWLLTGSAVSVAPDGANPGTSLVTIPTTGYLGPNFFGPTMQVGDTITIGGTNYVIANTSYTQNVLGTNGSSSAQNTQISITGSVTLSGATWSFSTPLPAYANGCGDDVVEGISVNGTQSWALFNYIEKIHWWASESHAMSFGFSAGPNKIAHNWIEDGACVLFSGGAAVDTKGGPANDMEIRGNVLGRDIGWRFLTGGAGNSPGPPFGIGPIANANAVYLASGKNPVYAAGNQGTPPFNWGVKNNFELKLGNRVLFDGNYLFVNYADGQSGYIILSNPRATSGGTLAGIYNILTANVTSASGSGTVATYQTPAGNSFYVGMAVEQITSLSPVSFNCTLCIVTAATSTQFQVASAATGSATGLPEIVYGTGTPATVITNVTISNNWIADSPQGMELGVRSLSPGNGGGLSAPEDFVSILNNAWTNVSDVNQWGNPGGTAGNSLIEYGGFGAQQFAAVMSRTGCPACVATATATPIAIATCKAGSSGCFPTPVCGDGCGIVDNGISATLTATGPCAGGAFPVCIVSASLGARVDPAMGQTATIYNPGGAAFSGPIVTVSTSSGVTTLCTQENYTNIPSGGPCIRPDGTFGNAFQASIPSLIISGGCSSGCTLTGYNLVMPTLAYKMLDMTNGDGVYIPGTGSHTDSLFCYNTSTHSQDTTYEVGGNSPMIPAINTFPESLSVSFSQAGSGYSNDSSGNTICALENGAGHPNGSIFSGNTVLTPSGTSIAVGASSKQVVGNVMTNNTFAGPTGVTLGWTCGNVTGEGNAAFSQCFDLNPGASGLTEWGNAIVNQSGSSPAVLCAGTSCYTGGWVAGTPLSGGALPAQNWSPNAYSASAPTGGPGTATAMGWPGFTGGTDTFPTGPCTYTSNDPTDCPLMGPPWSNNFTLASIGPVSSGGYPTYSVNVATMETAMTQLIYVLPASCATQSPACGTPYPDAPTFIPPPSNLGVTIAGSATMGGKATAQ